MADSTTVPSPPASIRWCASGTGSKVRELLYIDGTYDKDAGPDNQRLYLNGARNAQMSDTLPIDLNSAALGIGRHVSGIADPFNGYIDELRIAHVQRSYGWIEATVAGAEEEEGGDLQAARTGWYALPLAMTAHVTRASLLARATVSSRVVV